MLHIELGGQLSREMSTPVFSAQTLFVVGPNR